MKFCTEHGSITAVLSAKFQKDLSIEKEARSKRDFARFLRRWIPDRILILLRSSEICSREFLLISSTLVALIHGTLRYIVSNIWLNSLMPTSANRPLFHKMFNCVWWLEFSYLFQSYLDVFFRISLVISQHWFYQALTWWQIFDKPLPAHWVYVIYPPVISVVTALSSN